SRTIPPRRRTRTCARSTVGRISSASGSADRAASSTSSIHEEKCCRRTLRDCPRTGERALVLPDDAPRRLTVRISVAFVAVLALLLGQSAAAGPAAASQSYPVSYHSFALSAGEGTTLRGGALTLASSGLTTTSYADPYLGTTRRYDMGSWTSPNFSTGFGFTELVSSWIAQTPSGTFIRVYMSANRGDGSPTKWYTMGIWAAGDGDIYRRSVGGQGDGDGYIAIDT